MLGVVKLSRSGSIATSGVPQGGVLSPLLFAFAIDSLEPKFTNSTIVKFADDVCILHFVRNIEDDHLTDELKHVFSWAGAHGMDINLQKTKVLNWQTKQSLLIEPLNFISDSGPVVVDIPYTQLACLALS